VACTEYAPKLLGRVLSLRRSHQNFLKFGQIKKLFCKKHNFCHGEYKFRKKSKIGAKEILMLVYL